MELAVVIAQTGTKDLAYKGRDRIVRIILAHWSLKHELATTFRHP